MSASRDTGHRVQIVLYSMAVYGLSDRVKCRASSVKRSPGRGQEVSNKRVGDHETFKTANQHKVFGLDSAPFSLPSTQCMHTRMHSHTRSRTDTHTHTHKIKYTIANT